MKLMFFFSLLVMGYLTGRHIERKHYFSLRDREERYHKIPVIAAQWKGHIDPSTEAKLFGGSVVVGADYFKSVISGLRSVFGGRMRNYESLLDRGRREAILRMLAEADQWGAEKILNVRVETAVIGNQSGKKFLPCVEIYAYGTGVKPNNEVRS